MDRINAYTTIVTGEVQGGTTSKQLPDIPCSLVNIKAQSGNATNVYIGPSTVVAPDGTTDQISGFELDAGQETGWMAIGNLNQLWMVTDANGDDITYIILRDDATTS